MSDTSSPKRKKVQHFVQVYDYDFTYLGRGEFYPPVDEFVKLIQPLFKKWVFQEEACPTTGRKHYQGRGSLFKKKRQPELCNLLNDTDLRGMDVSESSNNSKSNELFYALKYDTRVAGPWMDTKWTTPQYIPRQYRGLIDRLHPYQQQVMDSRHEFNDRIINLVVDVRGNNGKSTCAALAELHHGCIDLPPIGDHKELTQVVCDILMAKEEREPGIIFVDLPRALTTDAKRFGPFMVAIEQMKKGHVCDVRHRYRDWWFDSPAIWVFCNHPPDVKMMSNDRWRFWKISAFKTLLHLSREEMSQMSQDPNN